MRRARSHDRARHVAEHDLLSPAIAEPFEYAPGTVTTALQLWRGQPLAGLSSLPWFDEHAARLDCLRRAAAQTLNQPKLALGEHAVLVGDLTRTCAEDPLNEELHAQLMLALYRCGRQAEALAIYDS